MWPDKRHDLRSRWPGTANVFASQAFISRAAFKSERILDDSPVIHISHRLISDDVEGEPLPLMKPPAKAFVGSFVRGDGFILTPDEAQRLLMDDPGNHAVILPYLNGADLLAGPDCAATRYIINFFDWPLEKARHYSKPFSIIEERVKPFRDAVKEKAAREMWWQYAGLKAELYHTASLTPQVLVRARVSDTHAITLVQSRQVFSDQIVVFGSNSTAILGVLQSAIHEAWMRKYGSTLKGDMRYSPTDCYDNFVFPPLLDKLLDIGSALNDARSDRLRAYGVGLTSLYRRFHDPDEASADMQKLRMLHAELDQVVADAYDWSDLDLSHDFHETHRGVRFTISEPARREVLQRLLKLNHERYAEEVEQGLHGKSGTSKRASLKRKAISKLGKTIPALFDVEEDDA